MKPKFKRGQAVAVKGGLFQGHIGYVVGHEDIKNSEGKTVSFYMNLILGFADRSEIPPYIETRIENIKALYKGETNL